MFKAFWNDESGATMIEYGLIGALISVAAIFALMAVGADIQNVFNSSTSAMQTANS